MEEMIRECHSVHTRHDDIADEDIGLEIRRHGNRSLGAVCDPHNMSPDLEYERDTVGDDFFIIDDQDTKRLCGVRHGTLREAGSLVR